MIIALSSLAFAMTCLAALAIYDKCRAERYSRMLFAEKLELQRQRMELATRVINLTGKLREAQQHLHGQ